MGDNPWDDYAPAAAAPAAPQAQATPSATPWGDYSAAPNLATTPEYSGSFLPFTRYKDGHVGFDSNAGIIGAVKSAFTLPHDVATGQVDPNSPEAIQRSLGMAGLVSPANPGMAAGDMAIPGAASALRPAKVAIPTAAELHAAGGAGFDAARDMGVEYASPAVANMAKGVQDQLNSDGILSNLAPKTHSVLDQLQAVPDGPSSVPFGSLDAARKAFGKLGQEFTNPTEQEAARRAKEAVTGFYTMADPSTVVAGPAATASSTLADAIKNSAAGFRSDKLNGVEDAAGLRADAANSGQNIGNATRQRVASLLLNPKAASGFNPDEIAALRGVTEGTPTSNTARILGNLLGGGGGMHGALSALGGAAVGHEAAGVPGAVAGALAPVIGWGAKTLDNKLTTGRLTAADEMTRQRSPLFQSLSANAPMETPNTSARDALLRAMLAAQAQPAQSQQ